MRKLEISGFCRIVDKNVFARCGFNKICRPSLGVDFELTVNYRSLRDPTALELLVCNGQIFGKVSSADKSPPIGHLIGKHASNGHPVAQELRPRSVTRNNGHSRRREAHSVLKSRRKLCCHGIDELPFVTLGKKVVAPVKNGCRRYHQVRRAVIDVAVQG